jgi:putative tricarboxylic transport membrane protein
VSLSNASAPRPGGVRAPQDLAGGLLLLAVAAFGWWQSYELPVGTLRQFGPGMVPTALLVLLAVCGVALVAAAFREDGPPIGRWSIRAAIFILGAGVAFGLMIRPLGFVVAGPVAVILASFAGRDSRLVEAVLFSVVMTAFCTTLFRFTLGLPIPVAPWLIGY